LKAPDNIEALDRDQPLIDFDQLEAATDGDAEVMRELVNLYFQQAGEIMAGLEEAAKAGDAAQINHLAHKLAGSSLACGMSAPAPFLRKLEHEAREGRIEGAAQTLVLAASSLEKMRGKAESYLASYKK
jgi:HPt (histidine-containing phosphotransfer) domain-containing protein